jgi:hypothetical protein
MTEQKHSVSGKISKVLRPVAITLVTFLFFIFCTGLVYNSVLYWQGRKLLKAVSTVKVGESLSAEAIAAIGRLNVIVLPGSQPEYDLNWALPRQTQPISFQHCIEERCVLSIAGPSLQQDHLYGLSVRHPHLILPVFRWIYSRASIYRWLPLAWIDPVLIGVDQGAVQNIAVSIRSLPLNDICPEVRVYVLPARPDVPAWDLRHVEAPFTGTNCVGHIFVVNVTTQATESQLRRALNLNLRCLLAGGHCSECDMLDDICDEDRHARVSAP